MIWVSIVWLLEVVVISIRDLLPVTFTVPRLSASFISQIWLLPDLNRSISVRFWVSAVLASEGAVVV